MKRPKICKFSFHLFSFDQKEFDLHISRDAISLDWSSFVRGNITLFENEKKEKKKKFTLHFHLKSLFTACSSSYSVALSFVLRKILANEFLNVLLRTTRFSFYVMALAHFKSISKSPLWRNYGNRTEQLAVMKQHFE